MTVAPWQCGRLMVGLGTDTYDPVCELPVGHDGPCKSTAATVAQFRLPAALPNKHARTEDQ